MAEQGDAWSLERVTPKRELSSTYRTLARAFHPSTCRDSSNAFIAWTRPAPANRAAPASGSPLPSTLCWLTAVQSEPRANSITVQLSCLRSVPLLSPRKCRRRFRRRKRADHSDSSCSQPSSDPGPVLVFQLIFHNLNQHFLPLSSAHNISRLGLGEEPPVRPQLHSTKDAT